MTNEVKPYIYLDTVSYKMGYISEKVTDTINIERQQIEVEQISAVYSVATGKIKTTIISLIFDMNRILDKNYKAWLFPVESEEDVCDKIDIIIEEKIGLSNALVHPNEFIRERAKIICGRLYES